MSRRIVHWDEQDAYTGWRKLLKYTSRPGVVKSIKRRTHRRERHAARQQIKAGDDG